ncbi:glycosyltransferase family 4 protein [Tenacibaculum sp. SG-28]|uniref:glycosyltransferase family 4 protein n=1 Tax=Tenacibaculum sp. SG-28 TaxID=754426 RepID=UPI000D446F86|nr:glycosyltransferase family 4 protein [Tenacibaculum sp. SG-28]PQJ23532.1 hypothetical protein BSU00_01405 [Tenacibaculum sp. SG-28]
MQRILVSVTNDITTDQRVAKVCSSLEKSGYEILLVGRLRSDSVPLQRSYSTLRLKLWFEQGPLFYAEYNIRLIILLLFTRKDIILANDLDTLPACYLASVLQRKTIVYDSHELFPEIPELTNRPRIKKIWECIEAIIVPKLANCYTVCDSIAGYYYSKYKTKFSVVKNVPRKENEAIALDTFQKAKNKNTIIYQGAVNKGRGIELVLESMHLLPEWIFLIIGSGDIISKIQNEISTKNLQQQVLLLGKLSPEELRKVTPMATIGISLEEDMGLSYRYALPNKVFDYIQARVPVLTSDLPEMKKIIEQYAIGEVLTKRTPEQFATTVQQIANSDYGNNLERARAELIWEKEEIILQSLFKNLR